MTQQLTRIVESSWFQNITIAVIVLAGILAGVETYPAVMARHGHWLHQLDKVILGFFTVELALKLISRGGKWWQFFTDPWNVFDFVIVAVCYIPMESSFAAVLRLVRVLRVLRLVTHLPRLQIIIGALLKSIPSMGYVAMLLALHFYIYGVMGTTLFGRNDPMNFGTIPKAMVSLFEVVTMEGWVDLMKIQVHGSDKLGYEDFPEVVREPSASPVVAVAYFFSFIMLGTMIILNLLIGVIMGGMQEAQAEREEADRTKNVGESGLPSAEDEVNRAEQQLDALKKQLEVIRQRLGGEQK
jgi:voltage-gated sodium channel